VDTVCLAAIPGVCSWGSCRCKGGSRAIRENEVKCNKTNEVSIGNEYLVGAAVVGVGVGATVGVSVVPAITFLIR